MNKSSQEKIDEVFVQCSNKSESAAGTADFTGISSIFWPILDNSLSLVDLAGVFAIAGSQNSKIDLILFSEFFNGVARVKSPTGSDYREKLLDNFASIKSMKIQVESSSSSFTKAMDRNVIKVLLKFDISLRRTFCSFAGKNISVGGSLTWDEVKKKSISMELDGFVALCTFYSVVPGSLSVSQVEAIAKTVLKCYPLNGNAVTLNSAILYPQFQLLMCLLSVEKYEAAAKRQSATTVPTTSKAPASSKQQFQFAKKAGGDEARPLADLLTDLLKKMGIDKSPAPGFGDSQSMISAATSHVQEGVGSMGLEPDTPGAGEKNDSFKGSVTLPSYDNPEDQYASTMNHGRQAMLLRMEHLFDEVESALVEGSGDDKKLRGLLSVSDLPGESLDVKNRLTSKPVVIGDAIPLPQACPEIVEQLLQAALAHHNLGSFRESLNFLEAARLQLVEIQRRIRKSRLQKVGEEVGDVADVDAPSSPERDTHDDSRDIPADLSLYILICKGNVYQSCGDDEQSLLQYMEGWSLAKRVGELDWEIICLNSIGILAYYSIRYEVALMAFCAVARYREETYGEDSADTATAWNNEGACLHALHKRREARVRLEKSWNVVCKVLGHRAPRCITIWKNLEKARRANASLTQKDLKETIDIRPDADRLLVGGTFLVKATVEKTIGKKKGKKGGKKK